MAITAVFQDRFYSVSQSKDDPLENIESSDFFPMYKGCLKDIPVHYKGCDISLFNPKRSVIVSYRIHIAL